MRIVFRPEARLEVLEAQAWYERRAPGLGYEFARAVDVAVQTAARRPEAHQGVVGGCQRVILRKFPYAVVYRAAEEELLIVAVYHHRRDPQAWKGRLGD